MKLVLPKKLFYFYHSFSTNFLKIKIVYFTKVFNLTANSNAVFWQHEWTKHGTCVKLDNLYTPPQYFALALDWLTKYDMFHLLAKNDILPGDKYNFRSIKQAIKRELGTEPTLRCVRGKGTNEMSLKEIYICFNKELQLIDCKADKDCADVINYPNAQNDTTFSICIIYFVATIVIICLALYRYKKNQTVASNYSNI